MSWPLLQEAQQNNTRDFSVYRCPDPVAIKTGSPWYTYDNICPCDPNLSNPSGRGFTACTFGINQSTSPNWNKSSFQLSSQIPQPGQIVGNLFNQNQYVPPQLDPRPLTRIGQAWRSAN